MPCHCKPGKSVSLQLRFPDFLVNLSTASDFFFSLCLEGISCVVEDRTIDAWRDGRSVPSSFTVCFFDKNVCDRFIWILSAEYFTKQKWVTSRDHLQIESTRREEKRKSCSQEEILCMSFMTCSFSEMFRFFFQY